MTTHIPVLGRRGVLHGMAGGLALAVAGPGVRRAAAAQSELRTPTAPSTSSTPDGPYEPYEPYVPVPVGPGGGPVGTDRVHVLKTGPEGAGTVLILVPGMLGAANDHRLLARDLVDAVGDLQVWGLDRREQNLADLSGFVTAGTAGTAGTSGTDPAAYYLGGHYRSQDPAASGYAARWGLPLTLEDLRTVVLAARRCGPRGRRVVLGGHSFGATTALAYAAWDFDGSPGYRDIDGLVLLDGGVHGAFEGADGPAQNSPEQVRKRLAAIDAGAVFDLSLTSVGLGSRPESAQIWYQLAGWYAHRDPGGRSVLQPRLPDALRPPYPVTNAALLGILTDTGSGWPNVISVHSGHLAESGDVRGWVDDGITPISRVAHAYAGPSPVVWEWYWPARLTVDLDVSDPYADTDLARSLGLRLRHATELDVPLYVFQTSYTDGTVESAARWVVANSRIPYAIYETDMGMNHLDPLFASPEQNTVTRTLPAFLRRT